MSTSRAALALVTVGLVAGCAAGGAVTGPPSVPLAAPETVYVLFLVDGPSWQPGAPVGRQDLAAHFAFVTRAHRAGRLVANGTLPGDGPGVRGMYVLAVETREDVDALLAEDPGLASGVLALEPGSVHRWDVRYDGLGAPPRDVRTLYVIDVERPAEAAVEALAARGALLTGGSLDDDPARRRYVLRAADPGAALEAARSLGASSARAWRMATRTSVAEARRRQR